MEWIRSRALRLFNKIRKYRNVIYYAILIGIVLIATIYAVKGYYHFQVMPSIENSNDVLNRILTPFVLAIIRFTVVMMFGILVLLLLFSPPIKKMKILDIELEFPEVLDEVKHNHTIHMNQLLFTTSLMASEGFFVRKMIDYDVIPFKETLEEVMSQYEEFFNEHLSADISYHLYTKADIEENSKVFENEKHFKLVKQLLDDKEENKTIIKKNYFGSENLLLSKRRAYGNTLILLMSSDNHTFVQYDSEIIENFFEFSKGICRITILMSRI